MTDRRTTIRITDHAIDRLVERGWASFSKDRVPGEDLRGYAMRCCHDSMRLVEPEQIREWAEGTQRAYRLRGMLWMLAETPGKPWRQTLVTVNPSHETVAETRGGACG